MIEKIIARLREEKNKDRSKVYSPVQCDAISFTFGSAIDIVQEVAKECGDEWIMVKDRMPEPHQRVLVFDVLGESITIESLEENETFVDTVIAWMPLPSAPDWQKPKKPYDGEKCRSRSITAATADSYCNDGCDMQCPYEKEEQHERECKDCRYFDQSKFYTGKWYCQNPNVTVASLPVDTEKCFEPKERKGE